MVTLALALAQHIFYEFSFAVFFLLLFERKGKRKKTKQNRVRTNEAASPGVRFWKKRIKLKSRLNSQRGAAK